MRVTLEGGSKLRYFNTVNYTDEKRGLPLLAQRVHPRAIAAYDQSLGVSRPLSRLGAIRRYVRRRHV